VADAEHFRRRFFDACTSAGERKQPVNVVIVGGGATGVELAAELSNTARALAAYRVHDLDPETGHPHHRHRTRPAPAAATGSAASATRGTPPACHGHRGDDFHQRRQRHADAVTDAEGTAYRADLTLWAAGVEAPQLCATLGLSTNHLKKIMVDASLRSSNDSRIYALGDCANYICPLKGRRRRARRSRTSRPCSWPTCWRARTTRHRPDFRYHDYGSLVSLGQQAAVGSLTGPVSGRSYSVGGAAASVLYRLLYQKHLLQLHGVARMVTHTLVDWLRARCCRR
jgi:NADH dehydrogenase